MKKLTLALSAAALSLLSITNSHAVAPTLVITEVDATGSSTGSSSYNQDWFELTNYSSSSINITGFKMDDSSDSFSTAVTLSGVTSIGAGQSVVFIESPATDTTTVNNLEAAFKTAWFGSSTPAGFTIGWYNGSGVGLSSSNDAVNIFNSSGTQVTGVDFNGSTTNVSFDNSVAKVTNDGVISTLSANGVNGAFTDGAGEIGSPGTVGAAAAPEPSSFGLGVIAVAVLGFFAYRRRAVRA